MFAGSSQIRVADHDYIDYLDVPLSSLTRNDSIESHNIQSRKSYYAHINRIDRESTVPIRTVLIECYNTNNQYYSFECSLDAKIAIKMGDRLIYTPAHKLTSANVLVDQEGLPCRIIGITEQYSYEKMFKVCSNKGSNMSVNGILVQV
jgi:hypothetical protein